MICVGRMILERLGCACEEEIIGAADCDFFPPKIAAGFVRDDRRVMESGEPIIDQIEVWYNEQHTFDWFVTSKFPARDAAGRVIGVLGTLRRYEAGGRIAPSYPGLDRVVSFIREHHRERIAVGDLARLARVSARQLQRRFQAALGMSIRDFLAKTRVQAGIEALVSTDLPIAAIAIDCGFCDQSAFTRQFREHTGMTPLRYRRAYARRPAGA